MSGPYNSYGGSQYQQPQGSNQYPSGGYSQQQYPPQQSYPSYPSQGYVQPPPQQYGGYQDPSQNFGPPRRADSFGPPQHGGFQHGQAGGQYGAYDASNPQGHSGYYSPQPSYGAPQSDAFAQNQAYQAQMSQPDQQQFNQAVEQHQFSPQSSDQNAPNYDPNAPPMSEGERGLLGSIGGGVAGHFLGKKANHGFLGTIGGAILGSLGEDMLKDKKKKKPHGHGHSSHHSQSSWGGGRY